MQGEEGGGLDPGLVCVCVCDLFPLRYFILFKHKPRWGVNFKVATTNRVGHWAITAVVWQAQSELNVDIAP